MLCEFSEIFMENLVKSPWENLCFGGFLTFGTTVCRGGLAGGAFVAAAGWLAGRDYQPRGHFTVTDMITEHEKQESCP